MQARRGANVLRRGANREAVKHGAARPGQGAVPPPRWWIRIANKPAPADRHQSRVAEAVYRCGEYSCNEHAGWSRSATVRVPPGQWLRAGWRRPAEQWRRLDTQQRWLDGGGERGCGCIGGSGSGGGSMLYAGWLESERLASG